MITNVSLDQKRVNVFRVKNKYNAHIIVKIFVGKLYNLWTHSKDSVMCVHIHLLFSDRTSVIVETILWRFCVYVCLSSRDLFIFFGKSFLFLFLSILRFFPFPWGLYKIQLKTIINNTWKTWKDVIKLKLNKDR